MDEGISRDLLVLQGDGLTVQTVETVEEAAKRRPRRRGTQDIRMMH